MKFERVLPFLRNGKKIYRKGNPENVISSPQELYRLQQGYMDILEEDWEIVDEPLVQKQDEAVYLVVKDEVRFNTFADTISCSTVCAQNLDVARDAQRNMLYQSKVFMLTGGTLTEVLP